LRTAITFLELYFYLYFFICVEIAGWCEHGLNSVLIWDDHSVRHNFLSIHVFILVSNLS